MGDPVVLLREGPVKFHVFRGLTEASCAADASVDSEFIRYRLRITQADGVIPLVAEWE